jgi:hypothetical protein
LGLVEIDYFAIGCIIIDGGVFPGIRRIIVLPFFREAITHYVLVKSVPSSTTLATICSLPSVCHVVARYVIGIRSIGIYFNSEKTSRSLAVL